MIRQPIFLAGALRSGTTILRLMLDRHPSIAWAYEFDYAVDAVHEDGTYPPIVEYSQWLRTHRIFCSTGFAIDETLDYPALIDSFLQQKLVRDRKSIIGASVHRRFRHLLRTWPDARFIHLVRDPRDVAVSCVDRGWVGNAWEGAGMWRRSELDWDMLKKQVDKSRFVDVRYEQLVAHPEQVLRELCGFLDVHFEADMLRYDTQSSYTKPDPHLASKWKSRVPARWVRLIEARAGELLEARAYQHSGLDPLEVSPLRQLFLRWHSRIRRFVLRTRKYGVALVFADAIARRLAIQAPRIRKKMNEIQQHGLK